MAKLKCRVCKKDTLQKFLNLEHTPLANSFLTKDQLEEPETTFPLNLCFCSSCWLVQLDYIVPPEVMFRNYIYTSGTSTTIATHFAQFAEETVKNLGLGKDSLVIDIGGNDGTLLKNFKRLNTRTLNIEPATNIAKMAESAGIETENSFWGQETAKKIVKEKGKAKVIIGTNVFAHVNDWDEFLKSIDIALDTEGIFIIEAPYLIDLLEKIEFDTVYHEHLSYISVTPLVTLAKRFGMEIFDCKRETIHGGSIRIFMKKSASKREIMPSVKQMVTLEKEAGLDLEETYFKFAKRVEEFKRQLLEILMHLKASGKKIAGYGAPAKGNTLLNYCKIGTQFLDYLVDKNPLKQGLYTPGTHIPIFSTEKLEQDKPDFLFVLAWNFAEEIMQQQHWFKEKQGKFIIPIPEPRIV